MSRSSGKGSPVLMSTGQEKYTALFNSIDQGFVIQKMIFDDEGHAIDWLVLEVNPAFRKITGLGKVSGRKMSEIVPVRDNFWFDTFGDAAKSGKAVEFTAYSKYFSKWFEVDAFPVGPPEEHILGILFKDITEKKAIYEALRQSEERFRLLTEATSDMIFRVSPDWSTIRFLKVNERFDNIEVPMQGWLEKFIIPEDRSLISEGIRAAIINKAPSEIVCRIKRANGKVGWIVSRSVPVFDSKGEIIEWFGSATDITLKKITEIQLNELNAILKNEIMQLQIRDKYRKLVNKFDKTISDLIQSFEDEDTRIFGSPRRTKKKR